MSSLTLLSCHVAMPWATLTLPSCWAISRVHPAITRWLHAARLPFLNSTERASHSCIYVIMTFQRTCNCGNITKNKVHDETVFVNSCDGDCSARRLVEEILLEDVYQRKKAMNLKRFIAFSSRHNSRGRYCTLNISKARCVCASI